MYAIWQNVNKRRCMHVCMLSVTMLSPIRQDAIKGAPVRQVKTAMVFKVQSRHVEFLLTY